MPDENATEFEKTPEYLLAPTLLPYLESAWKNSQHYDGSRMALFRLYFVFAGIAFLLSALADTLTLNPAGLLGTVLFVLLFGLLVQTLSVRYKERIIRDIRVIYKINDLLLQSPEEMKTISSVFHDYRKPQGLDDRRVRARMSTTRLFLIIIALISTGLLVLATLEVVPDSTVMAASFAAVSLLIHFAAYLLSKRGIAFNI